MVISRHIGRLGRGLAPSVASSRSSLSGRHHWVCNICSSLPTVRYLSWETSAGEKVTGEEAKEKWRDMLVPWQDKPDAQYASFRRVLEYIDGAKREGEPKEGESLTPDAPDYLNRSFGFLRGDDFSRRHIGPDDQSSQQMLAALSPPAESLDEFVKQVIPADILSSRPLFPLKRSMFSSVAGMAVNESHEEWEIRRIGHALASRNKNTVKSFIGQGYYGTHTPEVIKRNVLENPAWYTSYTPYQPEISQGRLESLLNYQTMVTDLTGLPIANASLLDEGTAAAEALTMSLNAITPRRLKQMRRKVFVTSRLFPQTKNVLCGRAAGFGVQVLELDFRGKEGFEELWALKDNLVGIMVQYPDRCGHIQGLEAVAEAAHKMGVLLSVATDLLALTKLKPPGEFGADIAFGSTQRFGVPMGMGGPHAAFFAVAEQHKRKMPGRLIGVSKDRLNNRALRLSLQTREQHIRREKATSNVCTAQALLANMASFYAVYHGPEGLRAIADRVHMAARVVRALADLYLPRNKESPPFFDTVWIKLPPNAANAGTMSHRISTLASNRGINVHMHSSGVNATFSISVDETTNEDDLWQIASFLRDVGLESDTVHQDIAKLPLEQVLGSITSALKDLPSPIPRGLERKSKYLTHPVFNTHHSETELLRYIHHLESKDLSLVHSMIPLGSCTMKLNASTEMSLITLPGFSDMHPFAPRNQLNGLQLLVTALSDQLASITGMDAVSLQPNSGAQGEFAGLQTIRRYHQENGQRRRDICLIPVSAHGTNPASAAMAGMRVVPVKCDVKTGNLDLADLEAKCAEHAEHLGAMMITYPSTFGVFEPQIKKVCEIVHLHGGQVYMDGANMNAQIGLCSPGEIGADVCHLNLHKTFCIPHGGGGPGVGPICVKAHLEPFLPGVRTRLEEANFPVSSASFGSASILPISWAYNAMMGAAGLKKATQITLLNANYLLSRLKPHYPILYTNEFGRCAHEFILDVRPFRGTAGIEAIDIAKRLQDYGFHAPTMSWPVPNTLMIEPTESESKEELDRFAEALISIREEIREIEQGRAPRHGNVLKMSPHPIHDIIEGDGECGAKWDRPYTREKAAYPLPWLKEKKFWPTVARLDDTYGDINLFCTCPPVEDTTGGNLSSVQKILPAEETAEEKPAEETAEGDISPDQK